METSPQGPDDSSCCSTSIPWIFPLLLLLVLAGVVLSNRFGLTASNGDAGSMAVAWTPSVQPTGETVRLEIDFGNGSKRRFEALPWQAEMTVADVMREASNYRPGIHFSQIGTGESGLLTEIDGLKNEGVNARNWLYEVAGVPATASFCVQKVAQGELVRWRFTDAAEEK
ncbi:DUF4430 domain-containing protein [Bythopirellula polymerisocia]|uniref:Uncharacterized protein n=1 Tax=Bythopirellula polymerisocia TaxID=2528003 RepID=A0A5C6CYP1_9BACT|nr:DUF4430 domain-containing protein [Bythopirellula polymerisocia]TWU30053.1 hypothetical protein Pla144_08390 [Bythopirellula polymerisocia]